jgi:hypothetical protein
MEGRQFSVKFSYFVAKNKVAIKNEIDAIQEVQQPSEEYKKYDLERARLAQAFADKNEDGSAKIHDNSFVITANVDEFQEALAELRVSYKDAIEQHEAKMKELESLLNEEVEINGAKVDFKDIPSTIEPSLMEILIIADLIIEDEE